MFHCRLILPACFLALAFVSPRPGVSAQEAGALEIHWQALAGDDAAKAFAAIVALAATPKEAVPWIKERLKPAAPADMKQVENLLKQLDSDQFKVRDTATKGLLKLDEQIVPALEKALAANPTLEAKQRLEGLRGKLTGIVLQGERLRAYRAIEVLERIGTPEARQVLQELAKGAPGALITTSAQAALKRCLICCAARRNHLTNLCRSAQLR
jgi:hypothetical protein